jgi:glycosyltransferase involved in cell wall biosynthesis
VKPRLLVSNIYFAPESFGGATIVAEHMAKQLQRAHGWEIIVVASINDPELMPYNMRRYVSKGIEIIGVKLPNIGADEELSWNNPMFAAVFGQILDVTKPDMVHLHSIQNMGANCIDEAKMRSIPIAATIHDCWYICERQFMINHKGLYCNQHKIDMKVCARCVLDPQKMMRRFEFLNASIANADVLLFPSQFHMNLHIANGFPASRCFVNKNGVASPQHGKKEKVRSAGLLRFGFVGGPGPIKGASKIAAAFKKMKRSDYELIVVDAAQKIGATWANDPVWKTVPGIVSFIPPYSQDEIDDVMAQFDILLFPSQWKESFGLTVREAIMRNVWVLATNAGGAVEDCIDGKNATLVSFESDVDTFVTVLNQLIDNPPPKTTEKKHIVTIEDQAIELDGLLRRTMTH